MVLPNVSVQVIPTPRGRVVVRAAWVAPCCDALHVAVWRTGAFGSGPQRAVFIRRAAASPFVSHLADVVLLIGDPSAQYVADDPCSLCRRDVLAPLRLRWHDRCNSSREE